MTSLTCRALSLVTSWTREPTKALADRVGQALVEGGLHQRLEERLLAADAAQVGPRVAVPHAVELVGEVAAAGEGEGAAAVEVAAAGLADVEAGLEVPGGVGEADVDAAERVHDGPEAVEVDQHVVVDGDAEVLLDRLHQLPRAALEGGVDAVLATGAGDRDDQVAGDGQHRDALAGRFDPDHQGGVVALAADVAVAAARRRRRGPRGSPEPTTSMLKGRPLLDSCSPGTFTDGIWPKR